MNKTCSYATQNTHKKILFCLLTNDNTDTKKEKRKFRLGRCFEKKFKKKKNHFMQRHKTFQGDRELHKNKENIDPHITESVNKAIGTRFANAKYKET